MAQSTVPAQGSVLPDEENCIVQEPAARHSGSCSQQPPHQNFDLEAGPPVGAGIAWYDARERELEIKYRADVKARQARAALVARPGKRPPQAPLDEDDDDYCYTEIKNLVFIEKSLIHRKALEEWDRKEKLFTSRVDRKSKKVGNLKNEVYQLIGFFSVFQGVVLTAVAQSNLLHCNNQWSPIVLSVLASVVTILAVGQKLLHIWSFQKTISDEQSALQVAVRRGQTLRKAGKAFVFMQLGKDEVQPKKKQSWWYTVVVLTFLSLFTLGFPLSHSRILCHPGHNPYG